MKNLDKGKKLILEICPEQTEESISEILKWLDELTEDLGSNIEIVKFYKIFEDCYPDLRGGEQKAIFGIWLAL
jgi:hypothetical protein